MDVSEVKDGIHGELEVVFGNRYDKQGVDELGESFDLGEIFRVLGVTETPTDNNHRSRKGLEG